MNTTVVTIAFCLLALLAPVHASPATTDPGSVQIPLTDYTQLIDLTRDPVIPAPNGYALGEAQVQVNVTRSEGRATAVVQVNLSVEILEARWISVPILPGGTPVDSVKIGGSPVQLANTENGLAWVTNKQGTHTVSLTYRIDAHGGERGFVLGLPLPAASAIRMTATLPGTGLDATVIPSAGVRIQPAGSNTQLTATIPTTRGVQLAWNASLKWTHSLSRAFYRGKKVDDAIVWNGELTVELFQDAPITLPLLPAHATLREVKVDGVETAIFVEDGHFATRISGVGKHKLEIELQIPIRTGEGPPSATLNIPRVPVTRFELSLPGKIDLSVHPATSTTRRFEKGLTICSINVPMTEQVTFRWSEGVPHSDQEELRANATLYHTIHAEEGVLIVDAIVDYEIRRGETSRIELSLPDGVQINRIDSPSGAVSDWRVDTQVKAGRRNVSVFLDRKLTGALRLLISYDGSLPANSEVDVPLLISRDVQRQRGMVALLSGRDLTLDPVGEPAATRVGENQLPAFVREGLEKTIAHTFKYSNEAPALRVLPTIPERIEGKFDVQIDTLVSLGDVAMTMSASIALNVKSGSVDRLELLLPPNVNLLGLSAPSLRTHRVEEDGRRVTLEFTQEMDGQFAIEATYEMILADELEQVSVPLLGMSSAEVEQGRIAVEALSAVEVNPAEASALTALDVSELPRQLILRTTNPILLAYKYVRTSVDPSLSLDVQRHSLVGVQEAAIDTAEYRTLATADGLLVTAVRFQVRNSRKQFLRVQLPPGSEVWSSFVDGRPEKPAMDNTDERGVLIKIIHSTDGFPVELVYATRHKKFGSFGSLEAQLARPDILVTHTRWDLFAPDKFTYHGTDTNLERIAGGATVTRAAMEDSLGRLASEMSGANPLRLTVPTAGVHFAFEKLYANQDDGKAWINLSFSSASSRRFGLFVAGIGVALVGLGAFGFSSGGRNPRWFLTAGATLGLIAVFVLRIDGLMLTLIAAAVTVAAALLSRFSKTRGYVMGTDLFNRI